MASHQLTQSFIRWKTLAADMLSASSQEGDVQLWSVARGKLVESIPCATPVVSVASLPDDPFILLAEEGGGLQVAALINAQGEPALAASEPHSIALQPYQSERPFPSSITVSRNLSTHGQDSGCKPLVSEPHRSIEQ